MKKWLYYITLVLLCIPAVQQITGLIQERTLNGAYRLTELQEFSMDSLFSGGYQKNVEKYISDHVGFRPEFVRLRNQIDYTFFDKVHTNHIQYGKDGYLFDIGDTKDYYGIRQEPMDSIQKKVYRLQCIDTALKARKKRLLLIIAPDKCTIYPEKIPAKNIPKTIRENNYQRYKRTLSSSKIDWIDFVTVLQEMKDTTEIALFPKMGYHWSTFAYSYTLDSTLHTLEDFFQKKMVRPEIQGLTYEPASSSDYDIGKSLNLLIDGEVEQLAYPNLVWPENDSTLFKPSTLIVADSYYWSFHNLGVSRRCFHNGRFWYYNRECYAQQTKTLVKDKNLQKEIDDSELIIILFNVSNLDTMAYGFIDQVYELLCLQDE